MKADWIYICGFYWIYICGLFMGWMTRALADAMTDNFILSILIMVIPPMVLWAILISFISSNPTS
jgi:hypothetical protein